MNEVLQILILSIPVLIFIALLIFFIFYTIQMATALFVWPPSIPTDKKTRKNIVNELKNYFTPDKKFKVFDLGCGYGGLVSYLSKNFPNAEVIGVELLSVPYKYSKFRFRNNPNIKIIKGDLIDQNYRDADAIVFFYKENLKLSEKLKNELKAGVPILSNNFELLEWQPYKIIEKPDVIRKWKLYCYKK